MKSKENRNNRLTQEEAKYIQELLTENKSKIKQAVRSVLKKHYAKLGEDCLSEINILVVENTKVLMKHPNPVGWVLIASRKVAANFIRKEYTRLKNAGNEILCDIPTASDITHEEALYNIWMQNNSIELLLNELTPREKEVYDLLYKKRLTSKQAGLELGISDSTVRTIDGTIKNKIKYAIKTKLL